MHDAVTHSLSLAAGRTRRTAAAPPTPMPVCWLVVGVLAVVWLDFGDMQCFRPPKDDL